MVRDRVKARRVGDSIVVTLTKPILEETQIMEDDLLVLETFGNGRVIARKAQEETAPLPVMELEFKILQNRLKELQAERHLMSHEADGMPTRHPNIDDPIIGELYDRENAWDIAKCEREIAEKELEILVSGGTNG